ncbi:MAG TPA: protein kinase [Vicinamibacterales bacterium]|nr:protein kinase [Vicinamibacterales bacterium]
MTPDRWPEVERLFHAALEQRTAERAAFLVDACAGDEALRQEVESLLALEAQAPGFLSAPAIAAADGVTAEVPSAIGPPLRPYSIPASIAAGMGAGSLAPGQQLGAYRVERLLGVGGMGEVYEAEHVEHGRRVALKVLSQRLRDPTDRARFLREGQLAASVSHPHVVYIYGSEEIAGLSVIAMELLPGGTLKDRVDHHGPLAPIDAIDVILQVVSGLDAAQAAGILHRDIKPSNCFVDADGTVKIGDFGLSIPTYARDVTQLSTTGTFQGTPQFASPEHLRGEPLDVRSDIYAVGATLHYLLTGQPPFHDRNLVALISRIATEPPPSLRTGRPDIPGALAALVFQCLAKDPAHRPASYRHLARVLEPLSSSIKTPAPLGMRFAAGFIDLFFSQFLLIAPTILLFARPSSAFGVRPVWENLVEVAYFAITESAWGASLGKALCGFQVVTENGARPRFARALLRALVFVGPAWLASGVALLIAGRAISEQPAGPLIAILAESIVGAVLFSTARRANGFAGIHERVSRTRTVSTSPLDVRRIVRSSPAPFEVPAGRRLVGPYVCGDAVGAQSDCGAALGYDERLRRTVWLRFPAADSDVVPLVRRTLRRPGRPRWLAGQRTRGLAWDAYEEVPGQPFERFLTERQSWATVRGWLYDLAEEVHAGLEDGSLPVVAFDRVWAGDDGRARLLDWPVPKDRPELTGSAPPTQAVDLASAERFLYQVAVCALEGHDIPADTRVPVPAPRVPLPLPATACLARLGQERFTTFEDMLEALGAAVRGPAAVSRTKRAAHLALCAIPIFLISVLGLLSIYEVSIAPREQLAPEIAELAACLTRLEELDNRGVPPTNPEHRALEIYVAGRHRGLISDPPVWSSSPLAQRAVPSQRRALAARVAATFAAPRAADVDEAARRLTPLLDTVRSGVDGAHPYIRSVSSGDVADRAGMKVNDVVVEVEGEPITFASQLRRAIISHPDQSIALSILRDGQPMTIRATPARRGDQGLLGIFIANEEKPEMTATIAWRYAWLHAMVGLLVAGTVGLLSAFAVRGGIALRLMNIAVVTRDGALASASRARWRAVVSWLPVLAAAAAAFAGHSPLLTLEVQPWPFFAIVPRLPPVFPQGPPAVFFPTEPSIVAVRVALITIALCVFVLGAVSAVITPERGFQDRLAGTWLVPR